MLLRFFFFGAVLASGSVLPTVIGGPFDFRSRDESSILDEQDTQETPLIELAPERSYKAEALLSHKSSISPYGKITGIRGTSDAVFVQVKSWKDVEDFVLQSADERVIVKIVEPWGTELVIGVTVNRKSYPAAAIAAKKETLPERNPFEKRAETQRTLPRPAVAPIALKEGAKTSSAAMPPAFNAWEAGLISLAIFGPHSLGQNAMSAPNARQSTPVSNLVRLHSINVEVRRSADEDQWLRESIDLADRLGVLSAKPVVTSDRRQRAFAIYTLYMAMKDLRMQVDLHAQRLTSAVESLAEKKETTERDHLAVVATARSYEQAMTGIMRWDADSMKNAVRRYTAELQLMDSTKSMLAFLSRMKNPPSRSAAFRAYVGSTEGQS